MLVSNLVNEKVNRLEWTTDYGLADDLEVLMVYY